MDTRDLATHLVDAKMSDGGGGEPEADMLHELLRSFHDALHAGDFAEAASHFRGAFQLLDSEPHEEYGEDEDGYADGGVAMAPRLPGIREPQGASFRTSSLQKRFSRGGRY